MKQEILETVELEMEETLEKFSKELNTIRTGQANTNMLDNVNVDYYGSLTPVKQIAGISIQEGRTFVIKPYDSSSLKDIEKALNIANLGIAPQNDGTVIRLTVPLLTEETRRDLCKNVKKIGEDYKVKIRNIRRDGNDSAKKSDDLTEDVEKDCLNQIQKFTDIHIKKIDELCSEKEKEVMKV